jgi:hypothetical protein
MKRNKDMKPTLKISFISLIAAIPMAVNAAPSASPVPLANDGSGIAPTQRVASTSYVQGAYNALGTQINNIIDDATVPTSATAYSAISSTNNVAENLVALDNAIRTAAGEANDSYVTKESAIVTPVEGATLNYLGDTSAGTNVGINFGILDNKIKTNQDAISLLNSDATTAGSVAYAVAAETNRATNAESDLSARIGTLAEDGRYITTSNSVAANLSILDAQVEDNMNHIGTMSALSATGNLTGDSRSSLVSAINALDAAISSAGSASNVVNGHYIGTSQGHNSVAENLTSLDNQVYTNTTNIGTDIATMGTQATTVTGAIKEIHNQTMQVATTWGNDTTTAAVPLFPGQNGGE